jgi:predicted RNA-binding Zn ribbon-like protein
MQFNAYSGNGVLLAEALCNLRDDARRSEVESVLEEHRVGRPRLSPMQLREVMGWRSRLRAAFVAPPGEVQVGVVNALLAETATRPYVSTHDGQPPHLHYADENADVVTRVHAVTAAGVAIALTEAGPDRLGRCAAPGCELVFVDVSRNGRRAYCSRRCATRVNVTVHRARSTADAGGRPATRPRAARTGR